MIRDYLGILMDGIGTVIIIHNSDQCRIRIVCATEIFTVAIFRILKSVTVIERRTANGGDAVRDGHAAQTAATRERLAANGGDTISDGHAGKAVATLERIIANGGDTVRDGHAGQAAATIERIIANGGDAVRDYHHSDIFPIKGIPANLGNRQTLIFRSDLDPGGSAGIVDDHCIGSVQRNVVDHALGVTYQLAAHRADAFGIHRVLRFVLNIGAILAGKPMEAVIIAIIGQIGMLANGSFVANFHLAAGVAGLGVKATGLAGGCGGHGGPLVILVSTLFPLDGSAFRANTVIELFLAIGFAFIVQLPSAEAVILVLYLVFGFYTIDNDITIFVHSDHIVFVGHDVGNIAVDYHEAIVIDGDSDLSIATSRQRKGQCEQHNQYVQEFFHNIFLHPAYSVKI